MKSKARRNMFRIFRTAPVCQPPIAWLKARAFSNMFLIALTAPVEKSTTETGAHEVFSSGSTSAAS